MDFATSTPEPESVRYTTITQVDVAVHDILDRGLSDEIVSDLTEFELPFLKRSPELRRLLAMKHLSRQSEDVTRVHKAHDEVNRAAFQSDVTPARHFEGFKYAFAELDGRCGGAFGGGRVRAFLDIGCAPGGFTAWVLENNRDAYGTGLTLSPEAKGLRLQLDSRHLERFKVQYEDVCAVAAGREPLEGAPAAGFDLVIAHAAIMFADEVIRWNRSIGLIYAQVLVAMTRLAPGGALVISIRSRPLGWVVDIMRLLLRAFASVRATNPTYQARRPFAYVVCEGFRLAAPQQDECAGRLRACLAYLEHSTGSVDDLAHGTAHIPRLCGAPGEPLPDAAYQDVLDLFTDVWQSKYTSIRANYERVLGRRARASSTSSDEAAAGGDHYSGRPGLQHAPTSSAAAAAVSWRAPQTPLPAGGSAVSWRGSASPDSYHLRREQRNAGINALFNRKDGVSGADRSGTWRRSQM